MTRCFGAPLLVACACHASTTIPSGQPDATSAGSLDAGFDASSDAGAPTCNGYEPCGVNPVMAPAGYSIVDYVDYDDSDGVTGSCTHWEDCGMWNTHFTSVWVEPGGTPYPTYYNRMGSPFPWSLGRYVIDVRPKTVHYVKLHIPSPGDPYVYSDGVREMETTRSTGATTCFDRSASHMEFAWLEDMGGTGVLGHVAWNISVLPGDMGNTGNTSTCSGAQAWGEKLITSDPVKAATPNANGKYVYCLLREGQDYYINFMSSGMMYSTDCSVDTCTIGGFTVANFEDENGAANPVVEVPCT